MASTTPTPPPSQAPGIPPETHPNPRTLHTLRSTFLLLALTLAGGLLRFWHLAHQAYWYDEGKTVGRIAGSFDRLLADLAKTQGFLPGWYVCLQWWQHLMERYTGSAELALHPEYLRALPAILGTLMIPAMYFLARQFTDRRGALLVALLTAVNPYLIYYSRDIKMYIACWFFLTLHLGIFFAWMSAERPWRYASWWPLLVLTGAAAVAMHATVIIILVLELLWLLTRPRLKSLDGLLWIVAVGAMLLLPAWWYLTKNQWVVQATEGQFSGLEWNADLYSMNWQTVWGLGTTQLLGYQWPSPLPDAKLDYWFMLDAHFHEHAATRTLPWLMTCQINLAAIVGTIMVLGLFPWRPRNAGLGGAPAIVVPANASRFTKLFAHLHPRHLGALATWWFKQLLRKPAVSADPSPRRSTAGRWWWLALWIALPVGLFALTWIPASPDPHSWYQRIWGWYLRMPHHEKGIIKFWEPRYLGIIIPALILWLAASLRRLPFWPVRTLAILLVLAASLLSALSNQLIYRQQPWDRTAQALKEYWDPRAPDARFTLALATPQTHFPDHTDVITFDQALGLPLDPDEILADSNVPKLLPRSRWARDCRDDFYPQFVDRVKNDRRVQTLILTDRQGDLAPATPSDPETPRPPDPRATNLSDAALAQRLGPGWKLVHSETYRWYYEWRYYFFHTWRTRVWQRVPPPAATTQR